MAKAKNSKRWRQRTQGIRGQKRWIAYVVKARDASAPGCNSTSQWQCHEGKKNVCVNRCRAEVNSCLDLEPIPQDESLPEVPGLWLQLFIWHEHWVCFHCCNTIPKHTGLPLFRVKTFSYYKFCIFCIFIAFVWFCATHSGKLWK